MSSTVDQLITILSIALITLFALCIYKNIKLQKENYKLRKQLNS